MLNTPIPVEAYSSFYIQEAIDREISFTASPAESGDAM